MDTSSKPSEDFWRYANGGWLRDNTIPADRSVWGSMAELTVTNRERLRTPLEAAASDRTAPAGSATLLMLGSGIAGAAVRYRRRR